MRLRIIAESNASVSIRRAENRATFSGSNSSKARRYPSRFFSTIDQLKSGLCAFEHEKLEVLAVIVDWDTPFAIVILEHQPIIDADPGAPFNCCTAHKLNTVPLNLSLAVNCYMYYDNMSRINNQFSVGVHIMTALGDHHGEQVTSAHLTASVRAHDSRVRSVLSKLVKAVEAPPVLSIHQYPKEKTCRTSCTHKQAMVELLEDTQRAFEARLGQRMLSEMVAKARSYK